MEVNTLVERIDNAIEREGAPQLTKSEMNTLLNTNMNNIGMPQFGDTFGSIATNWEYFHPVYTHVYPQYYPYIVERDNKFEVAYRIASKLIKENKIKAEKVKDFIDLVDFIQQAL